MKLLNFFGISYHFTPKLVGNINDTTKTLTETMTTTNNKILFFNGAMPTDDTLYEIITETALRSAYTPIMEVSGLTFTYTYTKDTKKKLIKKTPVDALDLTFTGSGTIGWAAVVLTDDNSVTDDIIIFTDSLGQWGEDDKPIILDKFTGVTGDKNIFKDFSLILRDVSSNEI